MLLAAANECVLAQKAISTSQLIDSDVNALRYQQRAK